MKQLLLVVVSFAAALSLGASEYSHSYLKLEAAIVTDEHASPEPKIAVNVLPVARPDEYTTKINHALAVAAPGVLLNDTSATSVKVEQEPLHGTLVLATNGGFLYTPYRDFAGVDTFYYKAMSADVNAPTHTAIVKISVKATAHAVVTGPGNICIGEDALINVDLEGEPPFNLHWSDGLLTVTSASNFKRLVQPGSSTSYGLSKIEDKNGPGDAFPAHASVVVNSRPAAPSILGNPTIEMSESLLLTASTLNSGYQWYRNGTAIEGAMDRTYQLQSATSDDEGLYTVTSRLGPCDSLHSAPVFVDVATRRIIPVIGSANGVSGSMFRSSIQIHNRAADTIGGTIDFYGPEPGAPLQTLYGIDPRGTVSITNVQSILGAASLGSVDVTAPMGPVVPDTVVRVYNDGGPLGTTGVTVPQVRMKDVLRPGERAVLIGPGDLDLFRFNIGIRTLEDGVEMNVRSYAADGDLRMLVRRWFPGNSFRQLRADDLAGLPLTENGVMTFEVLGGAAVIYGVAVENRTNDPSLQIAEKIQSQPRTLHLIVPAAASVSGGFGSLFKTAMQVHNPGASPLTLRIGFRTTQQIAGAPMPNRFYEVAPRSTLAIEDVLTDLGTSGIGSLDITSESFAETRPVFLVRVYNDGLDGQTGMTEPVLAHHEVPQAGDRFVLLAPTTPGTLRFNVGLRTLSKGATIEYTVRNSLGNTISAGYREFPTEYFVQQPATDFFGFPLGANDSVEFRVLLGAVAIYGATTDNITQDPSLQLGRR